MPPPTATIFVPYHALDEVHQRGPRASQPAAADVVPGTLYSVTDEANALERSDGTTWDAYAPAGGEGGGAPAAHHATHEPGGSDALVEAAWTDRSNTFAGDQTVDGDLFVTGTVNPLIADQRAAINRLIGDPTGSRMLMSSSYVSGLSLRHDEDLHLGKIACGNYDAQTYQPLGVEVESLQVRTGATPATLAEHVRVHPSGGLTVGAPPDHDTDPGVGIVRARGLDGTPLDATQLTSGTVPDARLSANVQLKPVLLTDLPATVATRPVPVPDVGPVPAGSLVGRSSGTGAAEPLVIGTGLALQGTTLVATAKNSGVFGYTFGTATTEPPSNQTVRFNAAHPYTAVTKVWVDYHNANSEDLYFGWMGVAVGSTLLVQDKDNHAQFAEFTTTAAPIDKGTYAELAVVWKTNGTALASQDCLVRTTSPAVPTTHHATHEPGGADALTALSATVLTSGTLPDARLSATVALRNAANIFTEKQELRVPPGDAAARLTVNEQTAPVNQRKWQLQAYQQALNVVALDDAESTALANFTFNREGAFRANVGLYERSRAYAMGEWQPVPFNAADYFPSVGTWTVAAGNVIEASYTLIGKTLIWSIYLYNTSVSGSPTALRVRLPNGMTHGSSKGSVFMYGGSVASGTGMAQLYYAEPTHVNFYRDMSAATVYPDGVYHLIVTVIVAIN